MTRSGPELTERERLLAVAITQSHRIPIGGQAMLEMDLERAIGEVDKLFSLHKFPLKDELLRALERWKQHAEDGRQFSEECDRIMIQVIRSVDESTSSWGRSGRQSAA
ncbi:hypothetical protein, partial [Actinophytocola sp.]|uniref:hypothetical protein n=1 Tax=Actinophytocola sp. TaxID=1872138 RepID=UPI002D7EC72D